MSKDLQVFDCQEFGEVRVIEKNGEPMFVASDIAKALGYTNPSKAIQDHCKRAKLLKSNESLVLDIPARGLSIIPESDVYRLIIRSTLPTAEKFECKVMEEILPSIRKTGSYNAPKSRRSSVEINARDAARSYRMLARMKDVYPKEMCAVFAAKAAAIVTGEPIQPLLPPVLNSQETWLTPTQISEHYGISAKAVGSALKLLGLHGETDTEHKHSQAKWDKALHSDKQVTVYIYNPDVILPALDEMFKKEAA